MQAAGQLGQSLFHRDGLFRQAMLGRVYLGQFRQRLDCPPQQVGGGRGFGCAIIQYRQGLLGQRGERFGVGQTVALLFKFRVFSVSQPGGFDLIGLEGQHFGSTLGILLGGAQVVQFTAQAEQVLVSLMINREVGFVAGIAVEQAKMGAHV